MFAVNADGTHLRELPLSLANAGAIVWGPQGDLYVSGRMKDTDTDRQAYRIPADGSPAEVIAKGCGMITDLSPDGKYLLTAQTAGDKTGIFQLFLADKKCTTLVPDVVSFYPRFSGDGKSVMYTLSERGQVVLYRFPWFEGKATARPQPILKLPFAFPQYVNGNAYDVARDGSKIVYVRPGGQFDLYRLSQK